MTQETIITTPKIHEAITNHINSDGTEVLIGKDVDVRENVYIDPSAVVLGKCIIENGVKIQERGLVIGPHVSDANDHRDPTILRENSVIEPNAKVREAAVIGKDAIIEKGAWICKRAFIPENTVVNAGRIVAGTVSE